MQTRIIYAIISIHQFSIANSLNVYTIEGQLSSCQAQMKGYKILFCKHSGQYLHICLYPLLISDLAVDCLCSTYCMVHFSLQQPFCCSCKHQISMYTGLRKSVRLNHTREDIVKYRLPDTGIQQHRCPPGTWRMVWNISRLCTNRL